MDNNSGAHKNSVASFKTRLLQSPSPFFYCHFDLMLLDDALFGVL
jgi:hypothetical protein